MKRKRDVQSFLILIYLGFSLRMFFVFYIPLYPEVEILPGYNDEPLHLHYVEHLASGKRWPIFEPTGIDSVDHLNGAFIHPPLYYKSAVPAYKIGEFLHDGWGLYMVRLVSVLYGIIAGIFAYRMAYILTNRRRIARFTLAAMMFAPNAIVFTSLVSCDALLICLSVMTLYNITLCRQSRSNDIRPVLTAVFLAAAVWTKLTSVVLIPLILFCAPPSAKFRQRLIQVVKLSITFTLLILPLVIWSMANYGYPYPGGGVPAQAEYLPEEAVGVVGGAVYHPVMAAKIFLRTAAMPFDSLWGSLLEKSISALWLLAWIIFLAMGTVVSTKQKNLSNLLMAAIFLMTAAFIFRGLFHFQVEFRTYAPIFSVLAILTALGYERLNLPMWFYSVLWLAPFAVIPFL